jgi:hypothetical protein
VAERLGFATFCKLQTEGSYESSRRLERGLDKWMESETKRPVSMRRDADPELLITLQNGSEATALKLP